MGKVSELSTFDPAEHLQSDQAIADFMQMAIETEDPAYIAHAMGVAARAKGMTQIAQQTGLTREQLYQSLAAGGNPSLRTTLAVIKALGLSAKASSGYPLSAA